MLSSLSRMELHILTQPVYIILDGFPETLASVSPTEDKLKVNIKEGNRLHGPVTGRMLRDSAAIMILSHCQRPLIMTLEYGQFILRYERLVLLITVRRYISQLKVCFRAEGGEGRQVQL